MNHDCWKLDFSIWSFRSSNSTKGNLNFISWEYLTFDKNIGLCFKFRVLITNLKTCLKIYFKWNIGNIWGWYNRRNRFYNMGNGILKDLTKYFWYRTRSMASVLFLLLYRRPNSVFWRSSWWPLWILDWWMSTYGSKTYFKWHG